MAELYLMNSVGDLEDILPSIFPAQAANCWEQSEAQAEERVNVRACSPSLPTEADCCLLRAAAHALHGVRQADSDQRWQS